MLSFNSKHEIKNKKSMLINNTKDLLNTTWVIIVAEVRANIIRILKYEGIRKKQLGHLKSLD